MWFDMTYVGEVVTHSEIHMAVLDTVKETLSVLLDGFKVYFLFHQQEDSGLATTLILESHCDFLWKENILLLSFLYKILHCLN